jgi:hypothetical protein
MAAQSDLDNLFLLAPMEQPLPPTFDGLTCAVAAAVESSMPLVAPDEWPEWSSQLLEEASKADIPSATLTSHHTDRKNAFINILIPIVNIK